MFSPRINEAMLFWYANRISDAASAVMFTAAFGVNATLRTPLAKDRDFLRFILMESAPNAEEKKTFAQDRDLIISFGAVLGETKVYKDGKFETVRLKNFGLDKWFEQEEHYRKQGNIFFVHTKFLLIDPLSDDPLVCTGSANFSKGSLVNNDENMILIRGGTRVADIYMTEFDRIFRHFYFRDVANEIEKKGGEAEGAFLKEDDSWTETYFKPGYFKCRRREMFFSKPSPTWPENAAVWKLGASEEAYALFHAEELAMNRKKRAAKKAASTAPAKKRALVSVKKKAAKKTKKARKAKKASGSGRR